MADDVAALLALRLRRAAASLTSAQMRATLTDLGVAAKKDVDTVVKADTGGDAALSNWRRIKFASGFEFEGNDTIVLTPRPTGPWRMLERGYGSHVIRPKRRGGRRAVRTPFGPRAYVRLGHGPAKHTWTKSADAVAKATPKRALDASVTLLRKQLEID